MKQARVHLFVIFTILIAAVTFVGTAVNVFDDGDRRLCSAAGIYDMLSPELIGMYETEIAGESIVSDLSESQLKKTAERLGIGVQKLKAIMLLQDIAAKVGRNIGLNELAGMNDIKIMSFAKQCIEEYLSTVSLERKQELEQMIKSALKR